MTEMQLGDEKMMADIRLCLASYGFIVANQAEYLLAKVEAAAVPSAVPTEDGAREPIDPALHNDHTFEPGRSIDTPDYADPSWCNVCGSPRSIAAVPVPPPEPTDAMVHVFWISYYRGTSSSSNDFERTRLALRAALAAGDLR
jgi:hypothetical protein